MEIIFYIVIGGLVGIIVQYNVIRLAVWSALRSHSKEQTKA